MCTAPRSRETEPIAANPGSNLNVHTPEQFAEAYSGRTARFYGALLAEIIRRGTPGNIVDLGAGLGLFVELAQQWGLDATGVEGSPYAVAEAKRRVPKLGMVIHDLGEPLPFRDGTVSNVLLNQVIEHVDPARSARLLNECHRILRAGGTLFVNSPSRRNRRERREPTHINMLLPSELDERLRQAGFEVVARPNYGFWFAPAGSRLLDVLASLLLRVAPPDWISGSANAIARK